MICSQYNTSTFFILRSTTATAINIFIYLPRKNMMISPLVYTHVYNKHRSLNISLFIAQFSFMLPSNELTALPAMQIGQPGSMNGCCFVISFLKQSCISNSWRGVYVHIFFFFLHIILSWSYTYCLHVALPPCCSTFLSCSHSDRFPVLEYLIFLLSSPPSLRFNCQIISSDRWSGAGGTDRAQKWIPYDRHYAIEARLASWGCWTVQSCGNSHHVDESIFSHSICSCLQQILPTYDADHWAVWNQFSAFSRV